MFVSPRKVVEDLDIRPGMKVADFGCGSGHYSIEIAKRIGSEGKVYSFDIQKEPLESLRSQAKILGISNIEMRRVDLEKEKGTSLAEDILDMVLLSNLLFQVEDKEAVIKEAFRVLKPGGRVVVLEWSADEGKPSKIGPKFEQRLDKNYLKNLFLKLGFEFEKEFEAGLTHYGLIFSKSKL